MPEKPQATIIAIDVDSKVSKGVVQDINVTLQKAVPCYEVQKVVVSTSGTTINYNIILLRSSKPEYSVACPQVIEEEVVRVAFTPQQNGIYFLNFLINDKLHQTREVEVSN